jgi:hypothetical protein
MKQLAITIDGFKSGIVVGSIFISEGEGNIRGHCYRPSQYLVLGSDEAACFRTTKFNQYTIKQYGCLLNQVDSSTFEVTDKFGVKKVFRAARRN